MRFFGSLLVAIAACSCVVTPPETELPKGTPPGDSPRGIRSLLIAGGIGTLRVEASEDIEVIVGRGALYEGAGNLRKEIYNFPLTVQDPGTAQPRIEIPNTSPEGKAFEAVIQVPADTQIEIRGHSGRVDVDGLTARLVIHKEIGEISVNQHRGALEVRTQGEKTRVTNVLGTVTIVDGTGDLSVSGVTGEVEIRDESGELTVETVTGNVSAWNNPGRPRFLNIDGDLTLYGIAPDGASVRGVTGSVIYPSSYRNGDPKGR